MPIDIHANTKLTCDHCGIFCTIPGPYPDNLTVVRSSHWATYTCSTQKALCPRCVPKKEALETVHYQQRRLLDNMHAEEKKAFWGKQ